MHPFFINGKIVYFLSMKSLFTFYHWNHCSFFINKMNCILFSSMKSLFTFFINGMHCLLFSNEIHYLLFINEMHCFLFPSMKCIVYFFTNEIYYYVFSLMKYIIYFYPQWHIIIIYTFVNCGMHRLLFEYKKVMSFFYKINH